MLMFVQGGEAIYRDGLIDGQRVRWMSTHSDQLAAVVHHMPQLRCLFAMPRRYH